MNIEGSDGVNLNTGTQIVVDAVYDGTNYTVTINDGTNITSKSIPVSGAHYYSSSKLLQFGGINTDNNLCAKCEIIDLSNTYILSDLLLVYVLPFRVTVAVYVLVPAAVTVAFFVTLLVMVAVAT
jgi:hypothetical protein